MEKLCIDVRGFSEEKKKRVQDAFFELGIKWFLGGKCYCYLDRDQYANVYTNGTPDSHLMSGSGKITDAQKPYAVTYTQLMQKAGLDDSDPDESDIERWCHEECERRLVMTESAGVEQISCDLSDDIFSTVQAINQCENYTVKRKLLNHLDALLAEQLRRHASQ